MLPSDLVRARVRGPAIFPRWLDPDDDDVRELSDRVHAAFADVVAAGRRLGEVQADLDEASPDPKDAKVAKGLAKLASDRCETALPEGIEPAALREEVFARAAAQGPLALERGPLGGRVAADVLAEVAAERGLTAEALSDALYADLPSERRAVRCDVPDGAWLVHRYNVALVQGLLLSAQEVRIRLERPSAPRMGQLFRWVKFHQLLHAARRDGDALELVLDGPVSVFGPSTRYGLQLARFFPALLLQDGAWRMTANVLWTKARHRKELVVTSADGLRSHYKDTGAWRTKAEEHFAARFAEQDRGWTLTEGRLPLAVGDRRVVYPDFTLTDGERTAHLEVLGHWRAEALAARLAELERFGPANLVLAVPKKLAASERADLPESPRLVVFSDVLPVAKVLAAAARVAAPADG
jgi:predicted nuclease of restriction endonuclease-like RecB superfamily